MSNLDFSIDWQVAQGSSPILRDTSGQLVIRVDDLCLTRNEDVWSRTVRDSVLVSAYPLALWLASSWWRLSYEPLPRVGGLPSHEWRMSHELGAANQGYVWPRIIFASDGESIKLWAESSRMQGQSVQYLYGLESPRIVKLEVFQRQARGFIEAVLSRLGAMGHARTDLEQLWALVREDQDDPTALEHRILEAQMGYDPEECPPAILERALRLQMKTGAAAMAELAPVIGLQGLAGAGLEIIDSLASQGGIVATPQLPDYADTGAGLAWQRGGKAARQLRAALSNPERPLSNVELYELLGISEHQVDYGSVVAHDSVAVARLEQSGSFSLIPRKKHPTASRFEYARFIAEMFGRSKDNDGWLVSTDISTARQQYQRAFAAEFLCPVESLIGYLKGDFSESSYENAAVHFNVSERTVLSLLANNGYLDSLSQEPRVPYQFVV